MHWWAVPAFLAVWTVLWIFVGLAGQLGEWFKRNGLGGLWNGGRGSVLFFRGALLVVLVVFLIEAANDLL